MTSAAILLEPNDVIRITTFRWTRDSLPTGERNQAFMDSWQKEAAAHLQRGMIYLELSQRDSVGAKSESASVAGADFNFIEYLVLSPLDYELDQLDLWEGEIVRHFRTS